MRKEVMSVNLLHKFEITLSIRETDTASTNDDSNKMTYTIISSPSKPTACPRSGSISSPRRIKDPHYSNSFKAEDYSISNDFTDKEILSIDNDEKFINNIQTRESKAFFNPSIDDIDNADMMNFPWIDMGTESRQSLLLPIPLPVYDFNPDQIASKGSSKIKALDLNQDPNDSDYYDDDFDDESRLTATSAAGQKQICIPASNAKDQSIPGEQNIRTEANGSKNSSSKLHHEQNSSPIPEIDNNYDYTNNVNSHDGNFIDSTRGVITATKHQYEYDHDDYSDHDEACAKEYDKSGDSFDFYSQNDLMSDNQQYNELSKDTGGTVTNKNITLQQHDTQEHDNCNHNAIEINHGLKGFMIRNSSWSSVSEQPPPAAAVAPPRCSSGSNNRIRNIKRSDIIPKSKTFPVNISRNNKVVRKEVDLSYLKPALSKSIDSASKRAEDRKKSVANNFGLESDSEDESDSKGAEVQGEEEKEKIRRDDNLFRRTRGNEPLFAGLKALRLTTPAVEVRQSVLSGSATKRSPFSLKKEQPALKAPNLTLSTVISLNNYGAKVKKKKKALLF